MLNKRFCVLKFLLNHTNMSNHRIQQSSCSKYKLISFKMGKFEADSDLDLDLTRTKFVLTFENAIISRKGFLKKHC